MQKNVLPFKLEFSPDEKITPYAGLCLYGELYKSLGINKEIERRIGAPGSGSGYSADSYIYPLTMMCIGGGKYIEDIRKIEADQGLREISRMGIVPSSDAIGQWLRRRSSEKEAAVQAVNDELVRRMVRKVDQSELTLDIDATAIVASKEAAKYTYKKHKGYMPMLGFIPEIDCCVGYEFREGNESPSAGNYEFVRTLIEKVGRFGKWLRFLRSDSAAYQARILNEVNDGNGRYAITAVQDVSVKEAIRKIEAPAWQVMHDRNGISTGREYAEFVHSMNESNHSYRMVVQRWKNPQWQADFFEEYTVSEYCYHVVASNWGNEEKTDEEVVWWHNERSNSENYNKEVKIGFNLEYIPCGEYNANAVWFGIGILAYNLFIASKVFLLPQSWARKTIRTVRWQFIQLAGKVVRHAGSVVLLVCGISRELYDLYQWGREQCAELAAVYK